jgi:hypothetical protein
MGWRHGSSGGAPASHVQSPEFKPWYWKKKTFGDIAVAIKVFIYMPDTMLGTEIQQWAKQTQPSLTV